MRRNLAIGAVVLVVLGLVAWWTLLRDGSGGGAATATGGGGSALASGGGGSATRGATGATATRVTLSGRVTRKADGSGVPGAQITLGAKRSLADLFARDGKDDDDDATYATADADGRWTLKGVGPGTYTVGASGKGLLPGERRDVVVAASDVTGLDIALVPGGAIASGTVSDVLGGPVPGARVLASQGARNPFGTQRTVAALTDDKGHYEMSLPPGAFQFVATHDAYAAGTRWLEMTEDPVTIDFTLTPGAQIRGQVVTTDGTPVPDALVTAASGGMRAMGAFGGTTRTTDAEGMFTLKGLAPGAVSVSASGHGYASAKPTVVELGIGEQVDKVVVVVEKGLAISGRVVAKGTTTGVPDVRVGVFSIGSGASGIARTASDAQGAFTVEGLRPGSYMLFAIGDEVMPEVGKGVELVDKDVTDVVVEMATGVTITGRVEPPQVASISIAPTSIGFANMFDAAKSLAVRGESDATGAFTLRHAPAGTFTLSAETTDGQAGTTPLVVEQVDKAGVVVKLEKQASIAGRVVDANGTAVDDVEVHATTTDRERRGGMMRFSMSGNGESSARVRRDGSFKIIGLAAGTYGLTVTDSRGRVAWAVPASKDKPSAPVEVTVAAAADKTGVTLAIELRDGTIKGVALLPDGKPAADTWITATMDRARPAPQDGKPPAMDDEDLDEMRARFTGGGYAPVLTGPDGRFAIEHLRRKTYKLVAESATGSARGEKIGVKVGESVTIQLGSLGTLRGTVTVNGAPVAPYDLDCHPARGTSAMAEMRTRSREERITDASGAYKLERLPPGDYECAVESDAGSVEAKVTVPAGEATLDLALVPWATVTGSVVSVLSGEPVVGVKLLAGGRGMNRAAMSDLLGGKGPTSDARGAFTVTRVAPGEGQLIVMPAASGFQPLAKQNYVAKPGERVDLGAIKVVPPRTGDAGTLGLGTDIANDMLTVSDVKPDGPAALAGVKVGDRIVSINGIDVATLTPVTAQSLIGSGMISAGQRFVLGLDRGGTPLQIPVTAAKW